MNRLQKWSALAVGLVLTLIVISGAAQETVSSCSITPRRPSSPGLLKGNSTQKSRVRSSSAASASSGISTSSITAAGRSHQRQAPSCASSNLIPSRPRAGKRS